MWWISGKCGASPNHLWETVQEKMHSGVTEKEKKNSKSLLDYVILNYVIWLILLSNVTNSKYILSTVKRAIYHNIHQQSLQ